LVPPTIPIKLAVDQKMAAVIKFARDFAEKLDLYTSFSKQIEIHDQRVKETLAVRG